jgi:hypothetical protein
MKKLFTYLLLTALALVSTECKVSNIEPVPQTSAKLVSVEILKPFVLKPNVYSLLLNENAKITSLTDKNIIIDGNYTISKFNGRVYADTPPDGSIVYIDLGASTRDGSGDRFIIEVLKSYKIDGKLNISYIRQDWYEGFKAGSAKYRLAFDWDVKLDINKSSEKLATENKLNNDVTNKTKISFVAKPTSKVSVEYINAFELEGNSIKYYASEFKITTEHELEVGISGEIEREVSSKLGEIKFPDINFLLGPVPVRITPVVVPKVKASGKAKIEGSLGLIKGIFNSYIKDEFDGTKWKPTINTPDPQNRINYFYKASAKASGELKLGLEFDIVLAFYKLGDLDCGQIGASIFLYGGITANCNDPKNATLEAISGVEIKPKIKLLKFPILDTSIPFKIESRKGLPFDLGAIQITCGSPLEIPVTSSAQPTLQYFKQLLYKNNFTINEGSSPPILTAATLPSNDVYLMTPYMSASTYLPNDAPYLDKRYGIRPFPDYKFKFSLQKSTNQIDVSMKIVNKDNSGNVYAMFGESKQLGINGARNSFTIIGPMVGTYRGIKINSFVAISGEINGGNIKNIQYAQMVTNNTPEPASTLLLLPINEFRMFESERIATPTSW